MVVFYLSSVFIEGEKPTAITGVIWLVGNKRGGEVVIKIG